MRAAPPAHPFRVGLTGNIASGKSAVADVWRELGAAIVDADELARRAVAPGSPALAAVAERFGGGVLTPEGALDREALRRLVFADSAARRDLEAITHPEIQRLREVEEARLAAAGARVVVHVVPLLFEVGLDREVDMVVVVDAPDEARLARLVEGRGLARGQAAAMMAAQGEPAAKRRAADLVVANDATLAELEARAAAAWRDVQARVDEEAG